MSDCEDTPMSEEEEDEDYEEEVETTEDEGEEGETLNEVDSGDDESPPVRTESNAGGSGKRRPAKEDAQNSGLKRKTVESKVQDGKIKKRKTEDVKKGVKTVASVAQKKTEKKKAKKEKTTDVVDGEVQAQPLESNETAADSAGEKNKKSYPIFEDKNVDYDYASTCPSNIVHRRCRISKNIIISCKNVEIMQSGQPVDIASLCFSRKTKNGKAFDYNMPLAEAPTVIKALQDIIRDNAKFFDSIKT
jgi:hypothetical protein